MYKKLKKYWRITTFCIGIILSLSSVLSSQTRDAVIKKIIKNSETINSSLKLNIIAERAIKVQKAVEFVEKNDFSKNSFINKSLKNHILGELNQYKNDQIFFEENLNLKTSLDNFLKNICETRDSLGKITNPCFENDKDQSILKSINTFTSFKNMVQFLQDTEKGLNKYNGSISSSYNYSSLLSRPLDVDNLNSYNVLINTQINKGVHPGEFNFSGNYLFNINSEVVKEQISDIFMSYDINTNKDHKDNKDEVFGFFQRTSNSFMGIESRYLAGLGITHDWISSKDKVEKEGEKLKTKLERLRGNSLGKLDSLNICTDIICKKGIDLVKLSKDELHELENYANEVEAAINKKYRRHRFGCLLGLLLEYEQNISPDSITVFDIENTNTVLATIPSEIKFKPKNNFLIQFRLHYESKITDYISFNLKPYLISAIPFTSNFRVKIIDEYGIAHNKWDMRILVDAGIKVKHKNASFNLNLKYNYDHLPAHQTYVYNGVERGYFAPNKYIMIVGGFKYEL